MTDQLIRLYRPMPVGSNPNDKPDLVIDGNPYVQILAVAPSTWATTWSWSASPSGRAASASG